jgi:hypothetical protein
MTRLQAAAFLEKEGLKPSRALDISEEIFRDAWSAEAVLWRKVLNTERELNALQNLHSTLKLERATQ